MVEIPVAQARKNFSDAVNRVAYGKDRVVLKRRGKGIVAMVPMEDFQLIEQMEEAIDLVEARKVLADARDKTISWTAAKKRLGL
jgi:antitoxin Phd